MSAPAALLRTLFFFEAFWGEGLRRASTNFAGVFFLAAELGREVFLGFFLFFAVGMGPPSLAACILTFPRAGNPALSV